MAQKQQKDDRKNRKLVLALALVVSAVAITVGVVFAFFSDVITGQGSATSGTLDLRGSFTYSVNAGTSTPIGTAITNLNPGDSVYVSASVTNVGNKSAWLRTAFAGTTIDAALKPYIYVYTGNVLQATLLTAENAASTPTAKDAALCGVSGYKAGGNGGTACNAFASSGTTGIGAVQTIQGTGSGAETDGTAGPITVGFTIYFAGYAPNTAQNKPLTITARAEGLQYRNNPSVTIDDTRWAGAESTAGVNNT
jgi:hypothetical protein